MIRPIFLFYTNSQKKKKKKLVARNVEFGGNLSKKNRNAQDVRTTANKINFIFWD